MTNFTTQSPPCPCEVCGRNMTDSKGSTLIGISLTLGGPVEGFSTDVAEVYPELEVGKTYNVCWVCWLRSLGVKV